MFILSANLQNNAIRQANAVAHASVDMQQINGVDIDQ
jgi:hypothetical protein